MRTAGGYPKYPIPAPAARRRLEVLESRVGKLEAQLARAPTPELWAERDGWAEERDALRAAFETFDVTMGLPRSGCGKAVHPDRASAERHAAALRLVSDQRHTHGVEVAVYGDCPVRRHPGWHVGHRFYPRPTPERERPDQVGQDDAA